MARSARIAPFLAWIATAQLVATPAAFAGDWYVDAAASNCAGATGSAGSPFCSVTDALAVAADGDTIHVAPGTYVENVVIAADVTLLGTSGAAATILDGGDAGPVVDVASGAVVAIDGFTIQNGLAFHGGGILLESGSSLALARSIVQDNACDLHYSPPRHGGGISVDHASLDVEQCSILRNVAYGDGGGIFNDAGTVVIANSTISDNTAAAFGNYAYYGYPGDGGGVCNVSGTVTMTKSTLDSNTAGIPPNIGPSGRGGSVYTTNGSFALEECTIRNSMAIDGGGGLRSDNSIVSIEACEFSANVATNHGGGLHLVGTSVTIGQSTISGNSVAALNGYAYYGPEGSGGGVYVAIGAAVVMDECLVDGNHAQDGAGLYVRGDLTMIQSTIRGNLADINTRWAGGGGLENVEGTLTLIDCAIVDNATIADIAAGGGLFLRGGTLVNCTVAGNTSIDHYGAASGQGGGLNAGVPISIDHCVIAGNSAASGDDVWGTVDSQGYNGIGDTSGATITGDPTGNLLDVDPQFADPANGDWSLAATSPCVDAGDPTLAPGGMDVARNPRLLDGDLDRRRVLDLGAYEFDNAHLAVTGTPAPGATLTFDSSGKSGLVLFLFVGIAQSELTFPRYGALFVDLSAPWILLAWGTIPSSIDVDVDPTLPVPLTVHVQLLALDAASRSGNFGNLVTIAFE